MNKLIIIDKTLEKVKTHIAEKNGNVWKWEVGKESTEEFIYKLIDFYREINENMDYPIIHRIIEDSDKFVVEVIKNMLFNG